jgi:hypothetical protein
VRRLLPFALLNIFLTTPLAAQTSHALAAAREVAAIAIHEAFHVCQRKEPHPLFNGVRRVIIAGLAKPGVTVDGDRVAMKMSGLQLDCARAVVQEKGQDVIVTLVNP